MPRASHVYVPSGREPKVKALFDSKRAEYLAGKDGGKSAGQMKKELAQVCQGPDTCTVGWPGRRERIAPGGACDSLQRHDSPAHTLPHSNPLPLLGCLLMFDCSCVVLQAKIEKERAAEAKLKAKEARPWPWHGLCSSLQTKST